MDFFLGITNKCNLSCPWCAHKRLRDTYPNYEMTPKEFDRWYSLTKSAGYTFECIDFNGLGEPTCYSDIDYLKYMLIRSGRFTDNVTLLTNGLNVDVLEQLVNFCTNIEVSLWVENEDILEFSSKHSKVHLHRNIIRHDVGTPYTEHTSSQITTCGCSGCGYTMGTIFLVCGTWCPQIVKDGLYHTDLQEYYLQSLSKDYGKTAFDMCKRCHANVSIPYKLYGDNEWHYNTTL